MKHAWGMTLLAGASATLFFIPQPARAQACKDETDMVDGSRQAVVEFTATVQKESLAEFEAHDHQKTAVNRLDMHTEMLGELIDCLDKASQDTTATKEAATTAKTQHDAIVKLLDKVKEQDAAIKGAKASKEAKALVEKIDLAP